MHLTWPVAEAPRRRAGGGAGAAPQESPAERAQKAIDAITELIYGSKAYAEMAKPAVINLTLRSDEGFV